MSNLRSRIASMNKRATIVDSTIISSANDIAQKSSMLMDDMNNLLQAFEAQGDQLSEIDYNDYTQLKDDFARFATNLQEINSYMSNFANDPGFNQ